jgi:ribosome maturation factor RimP
VSRHSNESQQALRHLVDTVASRFGVELVELQLRGAPNRRVLRVDIDRAGVPGVDVDDCRRVSEALGAALDEADLVPEPYVLEVSSPGADRPIRTVEDVRRNTGRRVVVTAALEGNGQRDYCGRLVGLEDGCLLVEGERAKPWRIPFDTVVHAKQEVSF